MAHTEAYRSFERGTAAGNKIFNLYHKKNTDSTLDPDLLARLTKMREEREATAKPKAVALPKSRAHVRVPTFGAAPAPTPEQMLAAKLAACGSKRSASAIATGVRQAPAPAPPVPARKAITDEDKQRLQHRLEFGEALPPPEAAAAAAARRAAQNAAQRAAFDPDAARFDELRREVADRRRFLAELADANGGLCTRYAPEERRRLEQRQLDDVQALLDEMRTLDARMRARSASAFGGVGASEAGDE